MKEITGTDPVYNTTGNLGWNKKENVTELTERENETIQ